LYEMLYAPRFRRILLGRFGRAPEDRVIRL
jgi:hypothetical protein